MIFWRARRRPGWTSQGPGVTVPRVNETSRLLAKAQRGETGAFEALVLASQGEIWRFCAYLIGRDEADDATQETFLAAWHALGSFRGESSARTWLFVIARRCALRLGERKGRWAELAAAAPTPTRRTGPGEALELGELLAKLSLERRTAFALTQLLGFSYAEAASVIDCPLGTVRSRVARAREDLARALAATGEAETLLA